MARDDRAVGDYAARAKDLAKRAPRAEDELDLALVEADHLQRAGQPDHRRFGQPHGFLRIGWPRRGGGCLAHQAVARWRADRRLSLRDGAHRKAR
jgi:hypothetical protein